MSHVPSCTQDTSILIGSNQNLKSTLYRELPRYVTYKWFIHSYGTRRIQKRGHDSFICDMTHTKEGTWLIYMWHDFVPWVTEIFDFLDFDYLTKISLAFRISITVWFSISRLIFHGTRCISCNVPSVCVSKKVLQCVAVCCSVLQCVAGCCSVLQCVADHLR